MKNAFVLFFLVLATLLVNAQATWNTYYTGNSNIPDNTVRCITFDKNHIKWIGTDYGLASFDGSIWTVYKTSNSGLPDNHVRSIAVDSNNTIWVGTLNGGLTKFDGNLWTTWNTFNSALTADLVRGITIDSLNRKWCSTPGGLNIFNDTTFEYYNNSNSALQSNYVSSTGFRADGTAFICTINGGLSLFKDTTITSFTIANSGFPDNSLLAVAFDSNNLAWLAAPSGGLIVFINNGSWLNFTSANSGLSSNALSDLVFDNQQNLWIATQGNGIIKKLGTSFMSYTTSNSGLPDDFINCINVDDSGVVWIGTSSEGLVSFNPIVTAISNQVLDLIDIYPNPAHDFITIADKNSALVEIQIVDIAGNLIKQINKTAATYMRLELKNFNAGVYFVKAVSKTGTIHYSKFIKL